MCPACCGSADLAELRQYRWATPAPSTPEQPTAPGRRVHIVVPQGACALCGVAVNGDLSPRVAFTVGRTTVSGQRCAACDSGVRAHGYDVLAYVDGKLGRDAEPDDFSRRWWPGPSVCTLPPGLSRWLGTDLVGRLHRAVDVPITHIVVPAGMPERVTAQAVRISIYIGESDRHGHTPLHTEIVQRARAAGLAGATLLHGVEGFGPFSVIHTSRLPTMSEDLPVVIVNHRHRRAHRPLPLQLDDLITGGLVVRETVDIIKYQGRTP